MPGENEHQIRAHDDQIIAAYERDFLIEKRIENLKRIGNDILKTYYWAFGAQWRMTQRDELPGGWE